LQSKLFGCDCVLAKWFRSAGATSGRAVAACVVWTLNAAALGAGSTEAHWLPPLAVDPGGVTVSGISSGGFAALQFAVAHSALVTGVGVIAAGPYYCAQLDPSRISSVCLKGRPDWRDSVAAVDFAAAVGSIDGPTHLGGLRAWVLAEGADPVVATAVVESAWNFLHHYSGELAHFERLAGAGHSMPTTGHGGQCGATQAPYLNDCGFDAAGRMLDYLYRDVAPEPDAPSEGPGELKTFDQAEFVSTWRQLTGTAAIDDVGYLFVPARCRRGGCRLHVALHGCRQGARQAGEAFVLGSGYIDWARRHATVVLYPQVRPVGPAWYAPWLPVNPEGCWDWWGYSGADYAVRSGAQNAAVFAMVQRLLAPVER